MMKTWEAGFLSDQALIPGFGAEIPLSRADQVTFIDVFGAQSGCPVRKSTHAGGTGQRACSQDRFVYRHKWQVGDTLAQDNRCTLHTGTAFNKTSRSAQLGERDQQFRKYPRKHITRDAEP